MRWSVFIVFAFAAVVVQISLLGTIEIAGLRPSLLAILGLFTALWAPRMTALWACFLLGLLVDLTTPIVDARIVSTHLIGPNALGFAFGCFVILQVRSMVMRRQLFATAVLAGVFVVAASLIAVAVLTVRSWFPISAPEMAEFSSLGDLGRRIGIAFYTALAAVPLGWFLLRLINKWRFQTMPGTTANWR